MKNAAQLTIYEINTPIFLYEVGLRAGHPVTFADVPDSEWDTLARSGMTAVWFMGVWERSPTAIDIVKDEASIKTALSDGTAGDLIGSAYSIKGYSVNDRFGGNDGLAVARTKLKERGLALILDFVPNHVAIDHVWATEHPEYFLHGSEQELQDHPEAFVRTPGGIFAKAKDPNYEPWSDVLQLNAFSPSLRQHMTEIVLDIASMSDGIRCDMAMLEMNTIFKYTWGDRVGELPRSEFWPAMINTVQRKNPDFLFIAEVYWDKQQDLLGQGFDFCYDKDLRDKLLYGSVRSIKTHLQKPFVYQERLVRFLENHDEERVAQVLLYNKHIAAAVIMSTLPGARLYHDGQREGRQARIPVHFGRRLSEPADVEIVRLYDKIWAFTADKNFTQYNWRLLNVSSKLWRRESHRVLAWEWTNDTHRYVIAVNYYHEKAQVTLDTDIKNAKSVEDIVKGVGNRADYINGSRLKLGPWQHVIISLDVDAS